MVGVSVGLGGFPSSDEMLWALAGFVTAGSTAGLGGRDACPEVLVNDPGLLEVPALIRLLLDVGGLALRNSPPMIPRLPPDDTF